ncbi:MAG TPA: VTC domain-containing protein, partial [Candidatus Eisenbacteria bacterium]|nr:VTC domain-containing protein [Candidatus Eisenbacteria bacterium]
ISEIHARPKVHITYLREAWVSTLDNSVRVTLDRKVTAEPDLTARVSTQVRQPTGVFGQNDVILELKFTNRFPDWFRELVRVFNCVQCGAAKYVEGASAIGEEKLGAAAALMAQATSDEKNQALTFAPH